MQRKKRILGVLRWIAFAACIALFVHALAKTDIGAGFARIKAIGPLALLALLPFPFGIASDAKAWKTLLQALGRRVPLLTLLKIRFATEAVTNSAPAGPVFAEALAPALVARRAHVPFADVVAASTAKRWLLIRMHGAYVALAAALGYGALAHASNELVGSHAIVLVVLSGALALVLLAAGIEMVTARAGVAGRVSGMLGSTRFARLTAWIEARRHHFTRADEHIAALSADRRTTTIASGWVMLLWLVEGCETFLILRLLGADLGLATVMSFDAALSVVRSAAVFAPGGIGVQDVGYLAILEAYGVPNASGIGPAFILVKRMKEAFWIMIGFFLLARSGVKPKSVLAASQPSEASPTS